MKPTIIVMARRWHDGYNTYHSVTVHQNGDLLGVVPFAYGYGTAYHDTALDILIEASVITEVEKVNGARPPLWRMLQDAGYNFVEDVVDVRCKKDLHKEGKR